MAQVDYGIQKPLNINPVGSALQTYSQGLQVAGQQMTLKEMYAEKAYKSDLSKALEANATQVAEQVGLGQEAGKTPQKSALEIKAEIALKHNKPEVALDARTKQQNLELAQKNLLISAVKTGLDVIDKGGKPEDVAQMYRNQNFPVEAIEVIEGVKGRGLKIKTTREVTTEDNKAGELFVYEDGTTEIKETGAMSEIEVAKKKEEAKTSVQIKTGGRKVGQTKENLIALKASGKEWTDSQQDAWDLLSKEDQRLGDTAVELLKADPLQMRRFMRAKPKKQAEIIKKLTDTAKSLLSIEDEDPATARVKVLDKDGKEFTVPKSQLDEALKQGYKQVT